MLESYFTWISTLEQGTGIFVFFLSVLLAFILLVFSIRITLNALAVLASKIPAKKRAGILFKIINIFVGKKSEKDDEEEKDDTMSISNSIDTTEVVLMISNILIFKEEEKKLEKEFMITSIKLVDQTMKTELAKTIREMIYVSDPVFYAEETEFLGLYTEAIALSMDEVLKDAIRENGLDKYTDSIAKKNYIDLKILDIINLITYKLIGVVKKMAKRENKEFLSYLESTKFYIELRRLFVDLFEKLIVFAIEKEAKRTIMKEKIIETFTTISETSESSIKIIKNLMFIK